MALLTENKIISYVSRGGAQNSKSNGQLMAQHNENRSDASWESCGGWGGGDRGGAHNIRSSRQAAAWLTQTTIRSDVIEGTHNSKSYWQATSEIKPGINICSASHSLLYMCHWGTSRQCVGRPNTHQAVYSDCFQNWHKTSNWSSLHSLFSKPAEDQ